MKKTKDVVDKIKKLLSLATSPNENEAKLAATRANELLIKHNLSLQEVQGKRDYFQDKLSKKRRASIEDKYVVDILRKYFFVEIVQSRLCGNTIFNIFGTNENVQVAYYVYEFLHRSFKSCFQDYRKATGAPGKSKESYYYGLYCGLCEQLRDKKNEVEEDTGIVLLKDALLKDFVRDKMGSIREETSRPSVRDQEAVANGYEKGKELHISRGIESTGNSGKFLN